MSWALEGEAARAVMEADFLALPLAAVSQAAIDVAMSAGAEHVDVRVTRTRTRSAPPAMVAPWGCAPTRDTGIGVRVLVDGVWGFASTDRVSPEASAQAARTAVALARVAAPTARERVTLAPEPVHAGAAWANPVGIDPFTVPDAEVLELLEARSATLLASPDVQHVDARFDAARDLTHYADSHGTQTLQQRTRVAGGLTCVRVDGDRFDDMSSCAPPVARGWEYLLGDGSWDWDAEIDALPGWLAEKALAPTVEPGPTTWCSTPPTCGSPSTRVVGHATELDRALGYEANYAGTSLRDPRPARHAGATDRR